MGKRTPDATWDRMIILLQTGKTVEVAAAECGVTLRTVHRKMASDPIYNKKHKGAIKGARESRYSHGTVEMYRYRACRCEPCRGANAASIASYREHLSDYNLSSVPHGMNGYGNYGCRCSVCTAACSREWRSCNDRSRDRAWRHGAQWSGAELELVASRPELTAQELAQMLGRTVSAVNHARRRLRHEPIDSLIAGAGRPTAGPADLLAPAVSRG